MFPHRNIHKYTKQNFVEHPAVRANPICTGILLRVISVDFDVTDQLLIIYSTFVQYLREKGNRMKQPNGYEVAWSG
jgi:hypothetical protein